jgi:zinc/manganese transport system permease protein
LSASPHGGEELKNLMVGHLLLIDRYEVLSILVVYGLIGALHFAFHRPVLLISRDPEEAYSKNINVRGWDLFFYTTFGIVVTSSTEVAGVLLVFTYLIAPAICGILVADTIRGRLITGWLIGSICSIFGVIASYFLDLPTGASIVCVFGIVTVIFIAVFGRESQS